MLRPMGSLGTKYRNRICISGAVWTREQSSITPASRRTSWTPRTAEVPIETALSKSGQLTFEGTLAWPSRPFLRLPVSGNDKFAYTFAPTADSQPPCPTAAFVGLGRESSGALQNVGFSETDPVPPAGYQAVQERFATDDPTSHLASLVDFQAGGSRGLGSAGSACQLYGGEQW